MIVRLGSPRSLWKEPVSNRLVERKGKFIGHVLREDVVTILDGPLRANDTDWYYVHGGSLGVGWLSVPGGWCVEQVLSDTHDFLDAYFREAPHLHLPSTVPDAFG